MPAPSRLASGAPSAPFAVSEPARRAGAPPPSRRRQWRGVPRSGTRVLTRASAACSRRALAHFSLDAGPRGTVARESKGTHGDVPDDRGSSHRIRLRRLRAPSDDDRRAARGAAPAALHGGHVPDRGEVVLGADAEEDAARGGAARGAARGLSPARLRKTGDGSARTRRVGDDGDRRERFGARGDAWIGEAAVLDLVKERLVADLQAGGGLSLVPVGAGEHGGDPFPARPPFPPGGELLECNGLSP